jgi:hypothetical protein
MSRAISSMRLPELARCMRDRRVVVGMNGAIPSITKSENVRYALVGIELHWNVPRCAKKNFFVKPHRYLMVGG